jgi:hypothetical protein
MSFASSLLGGGGGGGGGGYVADPNASKLLGQILQGNTDEQNKQADFTGQLNDLTTLADAQAKTLGIAAASRTAAATAGNKWITSGNGYQGVTGDSRQLGGQPWTLGA